MVRFHEEVHMLHVLKAGWGRRGRVEEAAVRVAQPVHRVEADRQRAQGAARAPEHALLGVVEVGRVPDAEVLAPPPKARRAALFDTNSLCGM